MTTEEEGAALGIVEIQVDDIKPVINAWDQLSEDGRGAVRALAEQLRDAISTAGTVTVENTKDIWDKIIEPQIAKIPPAAAEYLTLIKNTHGMTAHGRSGLSLLV